jgi:hypothetical protein
MMTTSLAEMSQTGPGKFVAFMVKHMSAPVLAPANLQPLCSSISRETIADAGRRMTDSSSSVECVIIARAGHAALHIALRVAPHVDLSRRIR